MAKVVKKKVTASEIEFNRWCVEMAMQWPVITTFNGGGVGAYGGGGHSQQVDADVLGRAAKIKAWVNA